MRGALGYVAYFPAQIPRSIDLSPVTVRLLADAICRVDAARSTVPVMARMSDVSERFWVRMNNSTRAMPEPEIEEDIRDRWRGARDNGSIDP